MTLKVKEVFLLLGNASTSLLHQAINGFFPLVPHLLFAVIFKKFLP